MESRPVLCFVLLIITLNVAVETKCTTRGRFTNNAVADCRGYTMCLSGAGDVYIEYDLSCPAGFVYNHIDSQCTINITTYQCYPSYNCSQVETIVEPASNCKKYIACINDLDGQITARLITCPENTIFSTNENKCVDANHYICDVETAEINVEENIETIVNTPNITVQASVSRSHGLHFEISLFLITFFLMTIIL